MIDHEKRPRHPSAWQMNGETLYPHSVMIEVLTRDVAAAVAAEREACAAKAREYASHYPEGSDGRNTFVMLAEWVEKRAAVNV